MAKAAACCIQKIYITELIHVNKKQTNATRIHDMYCTCMNQRNFRPPLSMYHSGMLLISDPGCS